MGNLLKKLLSNLKKLARGDKKKDDEDKQLKKPTTEYNLSPTQKEKSPFIYDHETQFPDSSKDKPIDIIIGFDFGTSTTKVVLRDPWARRSFAISFFNAGNPDSNSYLLPTRLSIDRNNAFFIPDREDNSLIKNIKIELVNNHEQVVFSDPFQGVSINAFAATSIYIACVLRYVRQWFLRYCRDIYKNNYINWQLNIGIPVKNYDDRETRDIFQKCALGAWWLSVQEDPINMRVINEMLDRINLNNFEPGINTEYINVIPEVAAEVAGYAQSPRRDNGLHLLIDIGARTLDVSTFVLHGEGEQRYSFLSTKVELLGAFELHIRLLEIIMELLRDTPYINDWKSEFARLNDATLPVPNSIGEYHNYIPVSERSRTLSRIDELGKKLYKETHIVICSVISITKKCRDPFSSRWNEGLPVFICGGGSNLNFYKDVINQAEQSMKTIGCRRFKIVDLPFPDDLQAKGLSNSNFHRIAVAYGLSFPLEDIGTIIPPSEIDDIEPPIAERDIEKYFISKDMV